jgi:hypothetical protein
MSAFSTKENYIYITFTYTFASLKIFQSCYLKIIMDGGGYLDVTFIYTNKRFYHIKLKKERRKKEEEKITSLEIFKTETDQTETYAFYF